MHGWTAAQSPSGNDAAAAPPGRAAVLLLHSDEPVTSIGRAVGWPDQSGFARRFKAHYGLSASAYRKRFATRSAHLHHDVAAAS